MINNETIRSDLDFAYLLFPFMDILYLEYIGNLVGLHLVYIHASYILFRKKFYFASILSNFHIKFVWLYQTEVISSVLKNDKTALNPLFFGGVMLSFSDSVHSKIKGKCGMYCFVIIYFWFILEPIPIKAFI